MNEVVQVVYLSFLGDKSINAKWLGRFDYNTAIEADHFKNKYRKYKGKKTWHLQKLLVK